MRVEIVTYLSNRVIRPLLKLVKHYLCQSSPGMTETSWTKWVSVKRMAVIKRTAAKNFGDC